MRETSPKLFRLKYLIRWARINGVSPKGPGSKPEYSIAYVTPHYSHVLGQRSAGRPSSLEATYLEGNTLYELGSAEMRTAALMEAELEIRLAEEKKAVWASPDVYDAVAAANERCKREDVKACADRTTIGPTNAEDVVRWMSMAMELAGSETSVVIGASGATLYFFKCSEQEAVRRLAAIPDANRVATPKKVLVKMVVSRMRTIQDRVREENERRSKHRMEDAKQAALKPGDLGHNPHHKSHAKPDLDIPEMDGIRQCRETARALEAVGWGFQNACRSLLEVLEKENLDDQVLAEAWNQVLVRNVLES